MPMSFCFSIFRGVGAWSICFILFSSCWSNNNEDANQTMAKYVLPAFKRAEQLSANNPDSTLLLCDYMLRLTKEMEVDSLRLEIELMKIDAILNKGFDEEGINASKQLIEVYQAQNKAYELARVQLHLAELLNEKGLFSDAEKYLLRAKPTMSEDKKSALYHGRMLNLQGLITMNQGRYKEAELSLNQALSIFEKEKSIEDCAFALQNIGNLHFGLRDSLTARYYYLQSAAMLEKNNQSEKIASIYNNIGLFYRYSNPDSALYYYNKVPKPNGDKSILNYYVIALFNKANIYKDRRDFDSARVIFDEVNDICVTNKILQGIPRVLYSYGDIEYQTGHFDKAINYLNQSLFWCDSIGAIPLKQDILNGKINMYTEKGKYKEALLLKEEYDRIDDSLKSTETKAAIQKAEINNKEKIRLVEKLADEKKIAQEKQTKMRWYFYIPIAILMLLCGYFAYRYYQSTSKRGS